MRINYIIHAKHLQKWAKKFGEFAEMAYLCGVD